MSSCTFLYQLIFRQKWLRSLHREDGSLIVYTDEEDRFGNV